MAVAPLDRARVCRCVSVCWDVGDVKCVSERFSLKVATETAKLFHTAGADPNAHYA